MEKYFFKQDQDCKALEKCHVLSNGTMIGSARCQLCEYCIYKDEDSGFNAQWIVCSKIDEAVCSKIDRIINETKN